MTHRDHRVVSVDADLLASAEVERRRRGRSTEEQLDHWIRVGTSVSVQLASARRRGGNE